MREVYKARETKLGRDVALKGAAAGALLAATLVVSAAPTVLAAQRSRIVFTRLAPTSSALYLADANGNNERPLLSATRLDYNASFSADGKWIIFTSERGGSADIYRVHPDGSGLERVTAGPSWLRVPVGAEGDPLAVRRPSLDGNCRRKSW